ncbi:nitroreductase/quinone reductase family protein [Gordonia sp. ABSL1-1]|uniref:nitroreductase/quinone reductase family protein n=1 Tax=Gordonia sp. ABSL1-1 TaxID=3053923 RepID=UPI002572A175|nr:nitroreductase/quinone reductase family protein [Gordonia sp. ABSL1-1]MDL9938837.1 nitroreductase/quinone reductase family protein [Gordonia sp. ABSL1-1]
MGFDTTKGTRGARQPGTMMRLVNAIATPLVRRKGSFAGTDALVLTTIGRKTGQKRVNPVNWFPGTDGSWLIIASAAGAASNPAWYFNIKANPDKVQIDVGGKSIPVHAEQLSGDDRADAWRQISSKPNFAKYQEKTDRELPIIRLTAQL